MLTKQTARPAKLITDFSRPMPTIPTVLSSVEVRIHNLVISNSSGLTSKVSVRDQDNPPVYLIPPTNLNDGGIISVSPEDSIGISMPGGIVIQSSQAGVGIKGNYETPPI